MAEGRRLEMGSGEKIKVLRQTPSAVHLHWIPKVRQALFASQHAPACLLCIEYLPPEQS